MIASKLGVLSEKLNTTPRRLLWRMPYVQLLQFVHVQLRTQDLWTVPPGAVESVVDHSDVEALLE